MIKDMYFETDGYEVAQKKSIFGALSLYLDFINMFQSLLFLFGDRDN
jgi:FtsH-binding integral membrane protein